MIFCTTYTIHLSRYICCDTIFYLLWWAGRERKVANQLVEILWWATALPSVSLGSSPFPFPLDAVASEFQTHSAIALPHQFVENPPTHTSHNILFTTTGRIEIDTAHAIYI